MAGEERSVIVSGCGTGGNRSGRINQRLPNAPVFPTLLSLMLADLVATGATFGLVLLLWEWPSVLLGLFLGETSTGNKSLESLNTCMPMSKLSKFLG